MNKETEPNRPGLLRRIARWHLRAMGSDDYFGWSDSHHPDHPTVASGARQIVVAWRAATGAVRAVLAGRRDRQLDVDALRADYRRVRDAWGYTAEQEPRMLRHMRVHRIALAVAGVIGMWLIIGSMQVAGGLGVVFLLTSTGYLLIVGVQYAVVSYRISVVSEQRYQTFAEYMGVRHEHD